MVNNNDQDFNSRIVTPLRLSFPVIALNTFEYSRAAEVMLKASHQASKHFCKMDFKEKPSPGFFKSLVSSSESDAKDQAAKAKSKEEKKAIQNRKGVVIFDQYYHERLKAMPDSAAALRASLDQLEVLGINYVIASKDPINEEFAYNVTLPTMNTEEISKVLDDAELSLAQGSLFSKQERSLLISTARGISHTQLKNVFTLSAYCKYKKQDYMKEVMAAKAHILRDVGLDIMEPLPIEDVGGLENLKEFLQVRKAGWDDGLPVKGILLAGVPGGGKSLCAKAAANIFGTSLIRLDMSKFYTKMLGDTELLFRRALNTIDEIAPAVVLIDEIEKMVSSGSNGDHEVSKRLLGSFLFWLQERKSQVFVVATANRIKSLPVELMRAGRWDRTFFIDIPNIQERSRIFEIHLMKMSISPSCLNIEDLVHLTEGYTGAEIEQVIVDSKYLAHARDSEVTQEFLLQAIQDVTPTSKVRADDIADILALKDDGFYPASKSDQDTPSETQVGRIISI
ncbi:AAA family ATPase [Vibrio sp. 10N.239.312.D08]|uniref:AAA family ATPase n=1 Tax=Vibrio sp. 10N.239.312.D08 TaxID=3229978 RepID=UPI00354DC7FD